MKSINKNGFTLIELSIVLIILGLIVGTVAPLIMSMTKKNKLASGRKTVITARDEIKGAFIQDRTLPTNLDNIGHTIDPWRNDLIYLRAPNLAGVAPHFAGIDLCTWLAAGTNQTGLSVCLDGDCTNNKKENIAFVIASIGSNFNRQLETPVNSDGNSGDLDTRIYDYGTEIDLYSSASDQNDATDQFDDIVQYVTVDELTQLVSCNIIITNNATQTICSAGAAVTDGADIRVLNYNQSFSYSSTSDDCITTDDTCLFDYNDALLIDNDKNGQIAITSVPPTCTLGDI